MSDDVESLLGQLDDSCPPRPEIFSALPVVPDDRQVVVSIPPPEQEAPPLDVRKAVEQHQAVASEILSSWRSDRQEIQDAANLVRDQIDRVRASGGNPSGTLFEMYIKALEVKAGTSTNAVRVMDATAKLLAATRSGGITQNNTVNMAADQGLVAILSRDPMPDDDI